MPEPVQRDSGLEALSKAEEKMRPANPLSTEALAELRKVTDAKMDEIETLVEGVEAKEKEKRLENIVKDAEAKILAKFHQRAGVTAVKKDKPLSVKEAADLFQVPEQHVVDAVSANVPQHECRVIHESRSSGLHRLIVESNEGLEAAISNWVPYEQIARVQCPKTKRWFVGVTAHYKDVDLPSVFQAVEVPSVERRA